MRTYYFNYEFFVPSQATIEVEAESFLEAIEKAGEIDIYDEGEFLCDFDASTDTRLYSIDSEEGEVARISVPGALRFCSWTNIDLIEQIDRSGADEGEPADEVMFNRNVHQFFMKLRPEISAEVRAEMVARTLNLATTMTNKAAAAVRL